MRIVIFSDSLGRPRPCLGLQDRTEYEDVYGHHLRQKLAGLCEVEICYFISLDSEEAVSLAKYQIAFRQPDLVIFHLGVNDCAPRVFKRGNRNIIFRPWFPKQVRRLVLGFIRRYRRLLTRYIFRNRVYVPLDRFRQNLLEVQEIIHAHSPHCLFLALSVVPTLPSLNHRSYGFNANVARYNVVLREVFGENYVDLDELLGGDPEAYLISDGIHLRKQSHIQVAEHLYTCITRLFEING